MYKRQIVRLSETYLNAAEAAVKNGDATKAAKYLKAIALRGNPDYTMPAKVTLDDVLEERRKELIGEGHRMFDLLRNNLRVCLLYTSTRYSNVPNCKS